MKHRALSILFGLCTLSVLIACGGGGSGGSGGGIVDPADDPTCPFVSTTSTESPASRLAALQGPNILVPASTIGDSVPGQAIAHTNHLINTSPSGRGGSGPNGFSPAQIRSAYNIPSGGGAGAIAVVAAYHYPTALNDFNVFSNQFGLPQETSGNALSSSNTAFQVVYADGNQPATDGSWAQEMALDTQWTHAMAPNAKIYLVEAKTAALSDLMAAVNVAKNLPGVKQVSMSFGITEDPCYFVHYDSAFVQPGVVFYAASGDTANFRSFPALSKNVVAVGGTSLTLNGSDQRTQEICWTKTGAGKSNFEPRQLYQNVVVDDVYRYRGACDIAAVADPNTGVSVYDSTPSGGVSGWLVFGGTSASTPIIAGICNTAGTSYSDSKEFNTHLYGLIGSTDIWDITSGTAGAFSCKIGWDFPTGVGVPNGTTNL